MSGHANIPARSQRHHNTGLVWKEVLSGALTPIRIKQFSVVRIRAAADSIVSMDGVTSLSLLAGEVEHLNVGAALEIAADKCVEFTFTGNVYVQVGKEVE
jgi:hypothetical protein